MKDRSFFTAARCVLLVMGLVIVFLVNGCKVNVREAKFTDKSLPDAAVLVCTGAGSGGGTFILRSVDGKSKDSEGILVPAGISIVYLEPGEHTIVVKWDNYPSTTPAREIKVTLPKGSITEVGFEHTGGSVYYLLRPLEEEQLNELLSFSGGEGSLLNNFHQGRAHLWKREE